MDSSKIKKNIDFKYNGTKLKTEEYILKIGKIFKEFKMAIYNIVNEHRKLIHVIEMKDSIIKDMCKVVDGDIDENGKIYITNELLNKFKQKIIKHLVSESVSWINYNKNIDKFLNNMFNFDLHNSMLVEEPNNKQLEELYRIWFGIEYKNVYGVDAITKFVNGINKKATQLNIQMFKNVFYEKENNEEESTIGIDEIIKE